MNAFACRIAALLLLAAVMSATPSDPFEWLQPAVEIDAPTRDRLERGEVMVRVLPATDAELGIFAAARLNADPDMLATWGASIGQLKQSRFVLAVRRFSDPPVFADLGDMALDDADLNDVRRCRPGDCALKLAADDMASLHSAAMSGGELWKDAVRQEFKRIVLNRVATYETRGFAGLPPYADRRKVIDPKAVFTSIAARSPYLASRAFSDADIESFFYWSKEEYGAGKPVIGVTHVQIVRPRVPSAVRVAMVSREILATHYRNGSLGLTAVAEDESGQRYLVYVNRSQLDVLGGIFGGWKRAIVEGRLKSESADVFNQVRRRLESGPPPDQASRNAPRGPHAARLLLNLHHIAQ